MRKLFYSTISALTVSTVSFRLGSWNFLWVLFAFCSSLTTHAQSTSHPEEAPALVLLELDSLLTRAQTQLPEAPAESLELATQVIEQIGSTTQTPHLIKGHLVKGQALVALFQLPEAQLEFEKAVELSRTDPDSILLARSLFHLGKACILIGKLKESLSHLQAALEISQQKQLNDISFDASMNMAVVWAHTGQLDTAINYYRKALPLAKSDAQGLRVLLTSVSFQFNQGTLEMQRDTILKAIQLSKRLKKYESTASLYAHLGDLYFQMGETEKATQAYFDILAIAEKQSLKAGKITAYLSLGSLYSSLGEYDDALQFDSIALQLSLAAQSPVYITNSHLQLGGAFKGKELIDSAKTHFLEALIGFQQLKSIQGIIECQIQLSKIYNQSGDYPASLAILQEAESLLPPDWNIRAIDLYLQKGISQLQMNAHHQAVQSLQKSLALAQKSGTAGTLVDIYSLLSSAYKKLGDTPQAFFFLEQHAHLKDSLNHVALDEKIQEIKLRYETDEKEKQLQYYQQATAYQQTQLKLQHYYLMILALLGSLALVIFTLTWLRFKHKKKTKELMLQNRQIELEKENLLAEQKLAFAQQKSTVFANLSHEFKTPLTLILAPLQQLLKKTKDTDDQKKMAIMKSNAYRLLELVDQSLDVAQSEDRLPLLECKSHNLISFSKKVLRSFSPLEETKNIQIHFATDLPYLAAVFDRQQIEKALSNILVNAFEHTESGGRIKVSIHKVEPQLVKIVISDNGQGIPDEHLDHIFDRFYKADPNKRSGSGVGLAQAKNIIESHEGSIKVESLLGVGTKFAIELPCLQSDKSSVNGQAIPKPEQVLPHTPKDTSIFVIDDNAQIRAYLKEVFQEWYEVHTFEDPHEALIEAAERQPALILTDVIMSIMDGYALVQQLKSNIKTSHIPVVLLTAKATEQDKVKALKMGADDHVGKPFHVETLRWKVKNLISNRAQLIQQFSSSPHFQQQKMVSNNMDKAFLDRCQNIVEDFMEQEDFDVKAFSREMGMSRSSLYNKVRSLTGENLAAYIRITRLRKAAHLLQEGQYNIIEIAYKVGFQSRQAFNKSFKAQFGMTPSEFRKSNRVQANG